MRILVLCSFSLLSVQAASAIQFDNMTAASGLEYTGGFEIQGQWCYTPFTSFRGGYWADVNGDGWLDVYVINHGWDRLYLNQGDGRFAEAPADGVRGRDISDGRGRDVHGAAWGDFDNDGDPDLYLIVCGEDKRLHEGETERRRPTRPLSQPNEFYVNEEGVLVESAEAYGLTYDEGTGEIQVAIDYNRDGLLDYLQCLKLREDGLCPTTIMAGRGDAFEDVGAQVGVTDLALTHAVQSDIDGDGIGELIVNGGQKVFDTRTVPFRELPAYGDAQDLLTGDYNNDLEPDVLRLEGGRLALHLSGAQKATDTIQLPSAGEAPARGISMSQGDFDNDGDLDVYVVTGEHRYAPLLKYRYGGLVNPTNHLLLNDGRGSFSFAADFGAEGIDVGAGSSVNAVDVDNDGFLDLYVTNFAMPTVDAPGDGVTPCQLYRNQGNENHWLQLDLAAVNGVRDALGARVYLTAGGRTQYRELTSGHHRRGQDPMRLHFGLAQADRIERLEIRWPGGKTKTFENLDTDRLLSIVEGQGIGQAGQEAAEPLWFADVAAAAGIDYVGESWGVFVGDVNSDGWHDVWTTNHFSPGSLWVNQKDGTFIDEAAQWVPDNLQEKDTHGAAWGDYDNDGDQDFVITAGFRSGKVEGEQLVYENTGQQLVERSHELNLTYDTGNGRTFQWHDVDGNGLLDLIACVAPQGQKDPNLSAVFSQDAPGAFVNASERWQFTPDPGAKIPFTVLSDVYGNDYFEILFKYRRPLDVYHFDEGHLHDVTGQCLPNDLESHGFLSNVDLTAADFNGDLKADLFIASTEMRSDAMVEAGNILKFNLTSEQSEVGLRFKTEGELSLKLVPFNAGRAKYLGTGGAVWEDEIIRRDDPRVRGGAQLPEGVDRGFAIGYDAEAEEWVIHMESAKRLLFGRGYIISSEPITSWEPVSFDREGYFEPYQVLMSTDDGYVDVHDESIFAQHWVKSTGIVAGDFDNDMDVDLFVQGGGFAINRPNMLYSNNGDGTFSVVPEAGGAEGTHLGIADALACADFDQDGYLDLFVINGLWAPPGGHDHTLENGPYELFQNQNSGHHWLQIDLVGTQSNRDGIGAKVFVTAGGKTQLREQNGGFHQKAQDMQRLHFGLADNVQIDRIEVLWPSGSRSELQSVRVDQILRIVEPES